MGHPSRTCFGRTSRKPLQTYASESEAKHQADYSRGVYGQDLTPYRCGRCEQWHLAPAASHTPSVVCAHCVSQAGNAKDLYPTEEVALRRAAIIASRSQVALRAYACPYEMGWHLTRRL